MAGDESESAHAASLRQRAEAVLRAEAPDLPDLSPEDFPRLIHDLQTQQIELEKQNEELRRAQSELVQSRDRYLDLYDGLPVGYMTLHAKGHVIDANMTAARMLGVAKWDLLRSRLSHFIHADSQDAFYLHRRQVLETQTEQTCEVRLERNDGTLFYAELKSWPVLDAETGAAALRLTITDVTDRKWAEKALRFSHRCLEIAARQPTIAPLLEEILEAVSCYAECEAVGIRLLDAEGNIPYRAYRGFSRRFYELESPLSVGSDQCMCVRIVKGEVDPKLPFFTKGGSFLSNGTTRLLATTSERDKGQTRNVCNEVGYESVALVPIRAGAKIVGVIHLADRRQNVISPRIIPVLERVGIQVGVAIGRLRADERETRLRAQLAHMARLTTMGEMATGLAHELNQPLAAISMFGRIASHYALSNGEENRNKVADACQDITHQAMRAGELIRRLRRFAKNLRPRTTTLTFSEVLDETLPLVESEFRLARIRIRVDMDKPLPTILGDRIQLEQVLLNLMKNALEAMQSCEGDSHELRIEARAGDGCLEIAVRDTGAGLGEQRLDDVFGAFYSTKPDGMGMGLAISRSIIEAHGGKIRAAPNPGGGAAVTFTLPTAAAG